MKTTLAILFSTSLAVAQTTWTEVFPTTVPPSRSGVQGCSDLTGMLVFGGKNAAALLNDLWRYDALTGNWVNLAPTGTPPSARQNYAAAYDSTRGVLVVFGGNAGTGNANISNQTWEWSATTNAWTNMTPATPVIGTNTPPQLSVAKMVYDPMHGHCLLFGGQGNTTTAPLDTNETWTWDGTNWTKLNPVTVPPVRRNHAMAYNPTNGTTMLFGGVNGSGTTVATLGDTWIWDGTNWAQIPTATTPFTTGSLLSGLVYDELRDRFVLTSGTYPGGTTWTNDHTYEFDGDWIDRGASGLPTGRYAQATAYVQAPGKTIQFGGYSAALGGIHMNRTFEYQTNAIADFSMQPGGCAGVASVPSINAVTRPWLGETHLLEAINATANSFHFLAYGLAPTQLSLAPFGFPACTAELSPIGSLWMFIDPVTGHPMAALQFPNSPAYAGLVIHSQVFTLEPTSQVSLSGRGDSVLGLR
jgi:hypothetical protein